MAKEIVMNMSNQLTINLVGIQSLDFYLGLFIKKVLGKAPAVLNWKGWEDKITSGSYSHNQGKSGLDILKLLKSGDDGDGHLRDGVISLDVMGFHSLSSTIAYTYIGSARTWFNDYFLTKFSKMGLEGEAELLAAIMHELCHRGFGFTHPWKWTRNSTVPYQVQFKTKDSYMEFYKNGAPAGGVEKLASDCLVENRIEFKVSA